MKQSTEFSLLGHSAEYSTWRMGQEDRRGRTSLRAFGEDKRRYGKGPTVGRLPDCRPQINDCVPQVCLLLGPCSFPLYSTVFH